MRQYKRYPKNIWYDITYDGIFYEPKIPKSMKRYFRKKYIRHTTKIDMLMEK